MTEVVTGTLAGMGCEVECALLVTRAPRVGQRPELYARCRVLQAPEWLPDGYYEAMFCGQSAFLHHSGGVWTEGVPWLLTVSQGPGARRTTRVLECMRLAS